MTFLKQFFMLLILVFLVSVVMELYFMMTSVHNPRILTKRKANIINEHRESGDTVNVLKKFVSEKSKIRAEKTTVNTTLSEEELYFKPRNHDVNQVHFTFLINHPKLCQKKQPYVIFLIHSTAKHLKRRNIIRNSWVGSLRSGYWNESHPLSENVVYLFLVGNSTLNELLERENEEFDDILLISFQEDYRNTIYKSYMGLRWIRDFCQEVLFVVKVDEDVFIHVPNLITYVRNQSKSLTSDVNKTIYGVVSSNNFVYRSPKGFKWTVSLEEYPLKQYPNHASGGIYFMSSPVAIAIINMADYLPLVHIEDAFFCGIIRHVLGFRVVSPEIHLSTRHIRAPCWFYARKNSLIALHPVGDYYMRLVMDSLPFLNETACQDIEFIRLKEIHTADV